MRPLLEGRLLVPPSGFSHPGRICLARRLIRFLGGSHEENIVIGRRAPENLYLGGGPEPGSRDGTTSRSESAEPDGACGGLAFEFRFGLGCQLGKRGRSQLSEPAGVLRN